jgi:hypothetical protein
MTTALLSEHEAFLNVALGAAALAEFTAAFQKVTPRAEPGVSLWHLVTVLPLVFHETSRRAISKRQPRSGLRSILTRDPDNDIAQNEPIFNLNARMQTSYSRTLRSLNCGVACGLIQIQDGLFVAASTVPKEACPGVASDIVKCAAKLGGWAAETTAFEYLTVLGVEVGP